MFRAGHRSWSRARAYERRLVHARNVEEQEVSSTCLIHLVDQVEVLVQLDGEYYYRSAPKMRGTHQSICEPERHVHQ